MNRNGTLRNMQKNFERLSQSFCEARALRVVSRLRVQPNGGPLRHDGAIRNASLLQPFPLTATTNQKANVVISDGAGFHPQQIPLTHVNQVSEPPFGPVAKRSASIIVRLTWVRHAGSGRIGARSLALRIAGERRASAAEPRINSWRRE
ncbi:hypothetical protein [Sinorhizobium fredii]|uniref:hypothetical protein n=1 Tax=Rhizobium fredii TaxID=380 RepID=UPI00351899E4